MGRSFCIHCNQYVNDIKIHLDSEHKGCPNTPAKTCVVCGEVTHRLEEHAMEKHGLKRGESDCPHCQKSFSSVPLRNKHEATCPNAAASGIAHYR